MAWYTWFFLANHHAGDALLVTRTWISRGHAKHGRFAMGKHFKDPDEFAGLYYLPGRGYYGKGLTFVGNGGTHRLPEFKTDDDSFTNYYFFPFLMYDRHFQGFVKCIGTYCGVPMTVPNV